MSDPASLEALAERVEQASGPDRDLDGDISIALFGWKLSPVPADADGLNAGETLTPDGKPIGGGFQYPPKGKVHRAYHCPAWTRDCRDEAFPRDAIRRQTVEMIRARAATLTSEATHG